MKISWVVLTEINLISSGDTDSISSCRDTFLSKLLAITVFVSYHDLYKSIKHKGLVTSYRTPCILVEYLGIGKGKIWANVLTDISIIHFSNLCSVLEPLSEQVALCMLLQKNTQINVICFFSTSTDVGSLKKSTFLISKFYILI